MNASAKTVGHASRYRAAVVRRGALLAALGTIACLALLLDLAQGPASIGLGRVLSGVLDPSSLDTRAYVVIWQVRLPDSLIALVIGAALGLAGVETQTVLNNPLASPYTLGFSAAATLGAAVAIVVQPALSFLPPTAVLPAFAFLFALGSALMILGLSVLHGGAANAVILYGIALVFLCNALTAALQYVASAEAVQQIVFWTIGNLTKAGWTELAVVALALALVLPFSLRDVWVLTALRGGEEHARGAGLAVARLRFWVMFRVSVLVAVAVCFVGAIGFVGLVGPHIARMLLGEDHRFLVPGACLTGAALLSLASFLSKALMPGVIIPVGIITAIVGVPVFLVLVATRRGDAVWR